MTLWCLIRTNEAELRGMQLTRLKQLNRLFHGGADTAQMADVGSIGLTIEHLTDAFLDTHLSAWKVARR